MLHCHTHMHARTQVAADEDLWFHVRGMPGSHVLLRTAAGASPRGAGGGGSSGGRQGPQQPSDADVQFAADCAAFFSKAKDSIKVGDRCGPSSLPLLLSWPL